MYDHLKWLGTPLDLGQYLLEARELHQELLHHHTGGMYQARYAWELSLLRGSQRDLDWYKMVQDDIEFATS